MAGAISYVRYYPTGLWTGTDEVTAVIVAIRGKYCPIFEDVLCVWAACSMKSYTVVQHGPCSLITVCMFNIMS
jgi:hypothetical protein